MEHTTQLCWSASMLHTMDTHHTSVAVQPHKAAFLKAGLAQDTCYLLSLACGYQLEIIKVIGATQEGMLIVSRAQEGTAPCIWPPGTLMQAKISAHAMDDLKLDPRIFLAMNQEVFLTPNGDVITKPMP